MKWKDSEWHATKERMEVLRELSARISRGTPAKIVVSREFLDAVAPLDNIVSYLSHTIYTAED